MPLRQPDNLDGNSPAVQSHLTMLQNIISRLASNSASCKTWCVTLVSALAIVVIQSNRVELMLVCSLPILLFVALDAYYLGLERRFRDCYDKFVRKLHSQTATIDDVFFIAPKLPFRGAFAEFFEAFTSFSIWPFYIGMAVILIVLGRLMDSA